MTKFFKVPLSVLFLFRMISASGQLSPPGLDGAKLIAWGAVGFNQRISSKWSTTIYFGGSSQSDPDNFSTFKKPAIFVLNQETTYQFNPNWQIAFCTSLRRQFQYDEDPPYTLEEPPWKKEIRYYLRLFYRFQSGKLAWTYSFRPEYRTFFAPDDQPWSTPLQWRFRLKGQVNIPVNEFKTNSIILADEWLFATEENNLLHWSALHFTENRLSTFFRHSFAKPALFLDIGMMHQFWMDKENKIEYSTYLSFDLLFQNPFSRTRKE